MATVMPTWVAAGTVSASTGAATPGIPTGTTTNDIMLLFAESNGQAISTPSGWAQIDTQTTTGTRLSVFWKRATASESAPTVADPGDHVTARIHTIRGCVETGNPYNAFQGGVEATSDTSLSATGTTTTLVNCLVVVGATSSADITTSGTAAWSGWTNASLSSLTERSDDRRTEGDGGCLGVATGGKATAGATGSTTATLSTSPTSSAGTKAFITIAMQPRVEFVGEVTDNFSTLSTTTGPWAAFSYGTIASTNGNLVTTTQSAYSGAFTYSTYNFTGQTASIRTDQVPTGGNNTQHGFLQLQLDSTNVIEMGVYANDFYTMKRVAGTDTKTVYAAYNPQIHRYWRIRESSGNTIFDFSTNGYTWFQMATMANPFAVTALFIHIGSGYTGTEPSPVNFISDNLNLPVTSPGNSVGVMMGAGGG